MNKQNSGFPVDPRFKSEVPAKSSVISLIEKSHELTEAKESKPANSRSTTGIAAEIESFAILRDNVLS